MSIFLNKPNGFNPQFEVAAIHITHKKKLLILHRQLHKKEGGKWGVPAGKLGVGESSGAAAVRELMEETGITLLPELLLPKHTVFVVYPGDYHFTYHMFASDLDYKPDVKISEEHLGFEWVDIKDLIPTSKLELVQDEEECLRLIYGN